jgi:thioredoxin reductase
VIGLPREVSYVIVGAGPGGLQLGYYLGKKGRDYVILERGAGVAAFFRAFPRHRTLISINKVHTGIQDPDTNLRWDWNSLLTDERAADFNFRSYSAAYFPSADDFVRYCADFAMRHDLVIEHDTCVDHVRRDGSGFVLRTSKGEIRARRLVMATGRARLHVPDIPGIEHAERYDTMSIDPKDFIDQRVMILGKGNSGFETADNLVGVTAVLHMASPSPIRLAWRTHYVGDLRAVNNNVLDTYQLKSQNTIIDATLQSIERRPDGRLRVVFRYTHAEGQLWEVMVDRVLVCTGFRFDGSIFDPETCQPEMTPDGKFPRVTSGWESCNIPDLFFAGALMHGRDYRKSFSGFIHGFRYNIECLSRLLDERYEGTMLEPSPIDDGAPGLLRWLMDRVVRCSSLFQLPGFLADLCVLEPGVAPLVYRDLPLDFATEREDFKQRTVLAVTMEYGKFKEGDDPFNVYRSPHDGSTSRFIHPVLRCYRGGALIAEHHIPEDLENQWDKPMYTGPALEFLTSIVGR